MLDLDEKEWQRLYTDVLLWAIRKTRTRDPEMETTNVDRAREATQQAFDRYVRLRPAGLDTIEAVRAYLAGGVRSALSNVKKEGATRSTYENAASTERAAMGWGDTPSVETLHLESTEAMRRTERARRILRALREELAGDATALGTIDCIDRGETEPAEQARALGKSIEEIYAARKRRKRAYEKVVLADPSDDEDRDEEPM